MPARILRASAASSEPTTHGATLTTPAVSQVRPPRAAGELTKQRKQGRPPGRKVAVMPLAWMAPP